MPKGVPPRRGTPEYDAWMKKRAEDAAAIKPAKGSGTGQPAEFWNNDEVLHNVRIREDTSKAQAFNVAIPTGEKYRFTFDRDGFYDVGCDSHPEMAAQIVATSSPYATLADNRGDFVIDSVPPGPYKAVVYTGAAKIERAITVPITGSLDLASP